jgi:pimeloyl-ACP methyl ester carboxylesterase
MMDYSLPMKPLPGYKQFSRKIELTRCGVELFAYEVGPEDGPIVVLVHGLADEADTWRHILLPLSQGWRVIAFDLPGFGRSSKPHRPYNMEFFQQVLLELLEVQGIKTVRLVGHSLGGMIVHLFGLEHPDRVDRLVLLSGSLLVKQQKLNIKSLVMLVPGLGEWNYNHLRHNPQAAFNTLKPYYANLTTFSDDERDFLFERVNQRVWDDAQRFAYFSTLRSIASWIIPVQRNLPERLAGWEIPTRVIWGGADQITISDNGLALTQIQPFTEWRLVPGAGHNIQQDAPQVLFEEISRGLSTEEP